MPPRSRSIPRAERPRPGEFVCHVGLITGALCKHAVVRVTKTRVYFQAWCTPDAAAGPAEWLPRAALEAYGARHIGVHYSWSRTLEARYQTPPPRVDVHVHVHLSGPGPLAALGLRWPCTRADVVAAFRARVHRAHPDTGGSTAKFIRLRRAYEQALQLVEEAS